MQNLLLSLEPLEAHFGFFGLLRPNSKIENSHLFTKNFVWCLVLLCKMMNQHLKFFGIKEELNTPNCVLHIHVYVRWSVFGFIGS